MKILVTGACGYQGSKLVPILLNKKHNIIAVDTQWFGNYLKNHKNLKIIKKNILYLRKQDLKGVDTIIHLASIANDPMGAIKQGLTWEISCLATMKLMENALSNNVSKFIFSSSASVYGLKKEKKVTENLSLEPISTYNKAKMIAERTILSFQDSIKISILRPATVCGLSPRMRFDLSVNMLTYQALKNKQINVFGGKQIRPNIHIDDLMDVYLFFLNKGNKYNGIFNAGFENLSILEIAKNIQKVITSKIVITRNVNDIRSYRIDSTKLLKLGFYPKKNIKNAINEINDYYLNKINKVKKNCFSLEWLKANQSKFFK